MHPECYRGELRDSRICCAKSLHQKTEYVLPGPSDVKGHIPQCKLKRMANDNETRVGCVRQVSVPEI